LQLECVEVLLIMMILQI